MRYLSLDKVAIGSKLGKDIVINGNQILLRNGALLTDSMLLRLKEKGINSVYIDDELTMGIEIEEVIPESIKSSIATALNKIDVDETIDVAKMVAESVYESRNISVENYDSNIKEEYRHAMLVSELSVVLGKALGYDSTKLSELASAALLHDIGKTCVDKKEMEEYGVDNLLKRFGLSCSVDEYCDSMHSFLGYSILNKNVTVSAVVKQAVLFHHENVDGTGELRIPGEKICEFAKIIHIANDFSRMITNAEKYNISNTNEVIEYFKANSGTKYDTHLVEVFFNKIPFYPPGMTIELSNGMNAIVVENNVSFPSRPIVLLNNGIKIDLTDMRFQSLAVIGINLGNKNSIHKQL